MSRKKPEAGPHEDHADETWLIPYSDLLTLLLALFIVLFASSSLDKKKMGMMENAFAAAFNNIPPEKMNGTLGDFLSEAEGLDLGRGVSLGSDAQGAVIEISSLSLFDAGKSELKAELMPMIKNIAAMLQQSRYTRFRVIVEGHTDDAEAADSGFPSKWELSSNRAAAVVRAFIASGLEPERMQVVGMGDIAPKYPNYNAYHEPIPQNQILNRRVVIRIEP